MENASVAVNLISNENDNKEEEKRNDTLENDTTITYHSNLPHADYYSSDTLLHHRNMNSNKNEQAEATTASSEEENDKLNSLQQTSSMTSNDEQDDHHTNNTVNNVFTSPDIVSPSPSPYETKQLISPTSKQLNNHAVNTTPSLPSTSSSTTASSPYALYSRRWYGLFVIVWLSLANSCIWINYAPISSEAEQYYHVSSDQINGFSIIVLAMFLPSYTLALWSIDKYGLRKSLIWGAWLQALGAWIRVIGCQNDNNAFSWGYGVAMFGQVFVGLTSPVILIVPCLYAIEYFPSNRINVATTIGVLANAVGSALGEFIPSAIVASDAYSNYNGGMLMLLIILAIFTSIGGLLMFFFPESFQPNEMLKAANLRLNDSNISLEDACLQSNIRSHPNEIQREKVYSNIDKLSYELSPAGLKEKELISSDPSYWSRLNKQYPLLKSSVSLLKNTQFRYLLLGYTVGVGIATAFITLIEQLIKPCGYDSNNAGNFGGLLILFGIIGSCVIGVLMDHWRKKIEDNWKEIDNSEGSTVNTTSTNNSNTPPSSIITSIPDPDDSNSLPSSSSPPSSVSSASSSSSSSSSSPHVLLSRSHAVSHMYRNVLRFFLLSSIISVLFALLVLRPNQPWLLGFAFCVVGFFVTPLLPIIVLLAADCSPNVSTDASTGLLQVGSNYGGIAMVGIISGLIEVSPSTYQNVFTPYSIFIFFVILVCLAIIAYGYNYQAPADQFIHDNMKKNNYNINSSSSSSPSLPSHSLHADSSLTNDISSLSNRGPIIIHVQTSNEFNNNPHSSNLPTSTEIEMQQSSQLQSHHPSKNQLQIDSSSTTNVLLSPSPVTPVLINPSSIENNHNQLQAYHITEHEHEHQKQQQHL